MLARNRFCKGAILVLSAVVLFAPAVKAQEGFFSPEQVIKYTPDWKGERFPDGRPKVPDSILDRMKNVTLEEAWATLRGANFNHELEDGWYTIHPAECLWAVRSPQCRCRVVRTSKR